MTGEFLSDEYIVLTEEETKRLKGPTFAFDPVALNDGNFILIDGIVSQPEYRDHIAFLQSRPRRKVRRDELKPLDPFRRLEPLRTPHPKRRPSKLVMNGTFEGPKLKILRANRQFEELADLHNAYVSRAPITYNIEQDSVTTEYVAVATVHEKVPPEFSAIVGDIIHNVRSALDLLLCDLVRYHCGMDAVKRAHAFPIADSKREFQRDLPKKAAGLPENVRDFLERRRPYLGGNNWLWALHRLDIADKHLQTIAAFPATTKPEIQLVMPFGGFVVTMPKAYAVFPLKTGSEIFRTPAGFQYRVTDFSYHVSFEPGMPFAGRSMEPVLINFIQLVEEIIRHAEAKCL